MIITAIPNAIPQTAILTIGLEIRPFWDPLKIIRLAINKAVFKAENEFLITSGSRVNKEDPLAVRTKVHFPIDILHEMSARPDCFDDGAFAATPECPGDGEAR
jgi:hypothetical protein